MSRSAMLALVGLSLLQRGGAQPMVVAAVPQSLEDLAAACAGSNADPVDARAMRATSKDARVLAVAPSALTFASSERTAALGDLDEDGLPDVVEPLGASAGLRIRFSDGAGGWAAPIDLVRLAGMLHVQIGDVDGDGHQDVVGTSRSGGELLVHLGDGAGGFTRTCATPLTGGLVAHAFELADLDGDGCDDLVMRETRPTVGALRVHLSAGAGYFGPAIRHPGLALAHTFEATDVDADGRADLVVVQWDWPRKISRVLLLPGLGDGSFGDEVELARFEGCIPAVRAGDLNGDGLTDVVVAASQPDLEGSGEAVAYLAVRPGVFEKSVGSQLASEPHQLDLADLDGDGALDLLAGSSGAGGELLHGLGDGTFQPWCQVGALGEVRAVADMDRDGELDLVCGSAAMLRGAS
jgi:FG-GAP-like repeat